MTFRTIAEIMLGGTILLACSLDKHMVQEVANAQHWPITNQYSPDEPDLWCTMPPDDKPKMCVAPEEGEDKNKCVPTS